MNDPIKHDDPRLQAVDAELMARLAQDLEHDSDAAAPSVGLHSKEQNSMGSITVSCSN